jgi:hypothetical protein
MLLKLKGIEHGKMLNFGTFALAAKMVGEIGQRSFLIAIIGVHLSPSFCNRPLQTNDSLNCPALIFLLCDYIEHFCIKNK